MWRICVYMSTPKCDPQSLPSLQLQLAVKASRKRARRREVVACCKRNLNGSQAAGVY